MSAPRWAGPRYATVVATVEMGPDTHLADMADEMASVLGGHGARLVGCDWRPDPDTIADAIGADYGTVAIVDLNPPR